MEQTEILLAIQQQLTILQSTIDTLREQSRQKDEEIERLRQIILNGLDDVGLGLCLDQAGTLFMHLVDLHAAMVDDLRADQQFVNRVSDVGKY